MSEIAAKWTPGGGNYEVMVGAPVRDVWPLLATGEGLAKWWEGTLEAEIPDAPGEQVVVTRAGPEGPRRIAGTLLDRVEGRKLSWTWPFPGGGWSFVLVFTLHSLSSSTRVRLREVGMEERKVPVSKDHPGHPLKAWRRSLARLRDAAEGMAE